MCGALKAHVCQIFACDNDSVQAAYAAAELVRQLEHDCRLLSRTWSRLRIDKAIPLLIEGKPVGLVHARGNLVGQGADIHGLIF
jgi:hypothetical protein